MAKPTPLSQKILYLRKRYKLTQSVLAEKIGVSKAAVSQFEKGDNRPSFETMQKLSDVLDFDLTDFYHESRPLKEASHQEIESINEHASLLELLQLALEAEALQKERGGNPKLSNPGQLAKLTDALIAQASAKAREAAMMRTYHLGENPSSHRDYDDRLWIRLGCEPTEAIKLVSSGRLRHQYIEARPVVTEQAVREFLGDIPA
jgi:transcriptional regulator with XRE-family HTH domain